MSFELSDGTICLQAPRRIYAEAALIAIRASIPELSAWTSWCHADYSRADVEKFLRRVEADRFEDRAYDFYILEQATERVLGGCGVYHIERSTNSASLGYWVRSDATRSGVATRAVRLLAQFGFKELELERLEIVAAVDNIASQKVAEKAGSVREGLLRNRLRLLGRPTDAVVFSIIPTDVTARK